jgi:hypothetical protein
MAATLAKLAASVVMAACFYAYLPCYPWTWQAAEKGSATLVDHSLLLSHELWPHRTTLISATNGICGVWLRFVSSTGFIHYYSLPKPCQPSANPRSRCETSCSR